MRVSPAQRSQRSKMGRISTLSEVHRHGRLGLSTRPNVVTRLPTVQRVAPKVASSGNASSFRDRSNGKSAKAAGPSVSTTTPPKVQAASSAAAAQPPADDNFDDPLLRTLAGEAEEDESNTGAAGWTATLGILGGIAVLLGGGYIFKDAIKHFLDFFIQAVDDWGVWGYVAYAAVYAGLEVLAVPAIPLTMTAGAIFGSVQGTIIVSVSATVAATIAFLIARYAARDKVAKLAGRNKRFAAIDRAISRNGLKFVTLLRLSPLLPLAVSNYLYGLTSVDLGSYVLGSWLGMLPGTYAYVTAGHVGKAVLSEGEGSLGVETWQVALALGATALALGFVGHLARQAVEEADKEALQEQQQEQAARVAARQAKQQHKEEQQQPQQQPPHDGDLS